jgi:hypothetical protein
MLTPAISDFVNACLHRIKVGRSFHRILDLLKLCCKVVAQNQKDGHRPLIDHFIASGNITAMLYLLLEILEGPNCSGSLQNSVVELCLLLPYHLADIIRHAGLSKLMKPLVLAFQSDKDDLRRLALLTLERWADSLNPSFLEPKIKVGFCSAAVQRESLYFVPPLVGRGECEAPAPDTPHLPRDFATYGPFLAIHGT